VGGGQTVYQNLVRQRPDDVFYYFCGREPVDFPRPRNCRVIPYLPVYGVDPRDLPSESRYLYRTYMEAQNLAAAVHRALGETRFEVVDTPDYRVLGLFLRTAMADHGIVVDHVALAMHGTLSSALGSNWPTGTDDDRLLAEFRVQEHLQFRAVDMRYAISEGYAEEWRGYAALPINHLDPLAVLRPAGPTLGTPGPGAPDMAFIGRRERRKGPDLFVDLAWWLPRGSFRRARLIGGDGLNRLGCGSTEILERAARLRGIEIDIAAGLDQDGLQELFADRSVVVLPSRYDQFNLVALEAILQGCPTVLSRSAGAAAFLRDRLPGVAPPIIDLDCGRTGARLIHGILAHYDDYRARLVEAVAAARLAPDLNTLNAIYEPAEIEDLKARTLLRDYSDRFALYNGPTRSWVPGAKRKAIAALRSRPFRALVALGPRLPPPLRVLLRERHRRSRAEYRQIVKQWLKQAIPRALGLDAKSAAQAAFLSQAGSTRQLLLRQPERSHIELQAKIAQVRALVGARFVGRGALFRELMRLERRNGNDLLAATYSLRLMRWIGRDRFGDLPFVIDTLGRHGYLAEAETASAMFDADPARSRVRCRDLIARQFARHRIKPTLPLELVDDRRGAGGSAAGPAAGPAADPGKVSVIVSLYKAASKLPTFLAMLRQQTLLAEGRVEIVFVDSGSPTDEYAVFSREMAESGLPAVYLRSATRETIQGAWNRGIQMARGEYLTFLGVDEGIHPSCLETLAGELDRHASVDWVMANSIVTNVDRKGVFDNDIMIYDRADYRQDRAYLDSTFLSYVGGLYRRSVHDRFGYYDEGFTAAGDTEFKNRILPYITSRFVKQTLGVFNNYPEERTTAHPRAEIEDLRAWYLHRTVAGMEVAFADAPTERLAALFDDTLRYRKCYCYHWSTDLDLAASLATLLEAREDAGAHAGMRPEIETLLAIYRSVELDERARRGATPSFLGFLGKAMRVHKLQQRHRATLDLPQKPAYLIFNDNRFEQHWWPWAS
jgi:glycosyltransferase involved in cell wall biosynthesis